MERRGEAGLFLGMMFEKYTVIKAVISTEVLLRQLHKGKTLSILKKFKRTLQKR